MRSVSLSVLALAASGALASADDSPKPTFTPTTIKAPFVEQFTKDWLVRWTSSEATKKTPVGKETFSYVGKWEVEDPSISVVEGEQGLVAKTKAAHHAISAPFDGPISFSDKPLVVQYEVKYQKGGNCGGGYLKLLEDGFQTSGKEFSDTTPWVIMFGPDLTCPGTKVHFIFRHKSPVTGEFEEKHLKLPPRPSIEKFTNLYTLIVHPNNTYDVLLDGESKQTGSLLEDFEPAVNPPTKIDDPEDKKPEDWVDEKTIPDPDAKKPDDWDEAAPYEIVDEEAEKPEGWLDDEPLTIPDPDAEKPDEWDDAEDGDWIAPTVANPKCSDAGCGEWKRPVKVNPEYKGKWYAPSIDNPAYKGEWAPRQIANPKYFEDPTPIKSLSKIGGVGIELWTMTEDILFTNIYIGHSIEDAKALAAETFDIKKPLERAADEKSEEEAQDESPISSFRDDPISFIRSKVITFVESVKEDPISAFKSQPETGAALVATLFTFLSMFGALFGLIGGAPKPVVTKSTKKTEGTKITAAPVAPAGGEKKEEENSTAKKRAGK